MQAALAQRSPNAHRQSSSQSPKCARAWRTRGLILRPSIGIHPEADGALIYTVLMSQPWTRRNRGRVHWDWDPDGWRAAREPSCIARARRVCASSPKDTPVCETSSCPIAAPAGRSGAVTGATLETRASPQRRKPLRFACENGAWRCATPDFRAGSSRVICSGMASPPGIERSPALGAKRRRSGSDVVRNACARSRFPTSSLIPGELSRPLHDAWSNYLGNAAPQMLALPARKSRSPSAWLCQGHRRANGGKRCTRMSEPPPLITPSCDLPPNAWCDRIRFAASAPTGPVDAMKRRPGSTGFHQHRTRSGRRFHTFAPIIKWDDQPAPPGPRRGAYSCFISVSCARPSRLGPSMSISRPRCRSASSPPNHLPPPIEAAVAHAPVASRAPRPMPCPCWSQRC